MAQYRSESDTGRRPASHGERVLGSLFQWVPNPMAVLDGAGRILELNKAWLALPGAACCGAIRELGATYPDALVSHADACPEAASLAAGIRRVLSGETTLFELEHSCPAIPEGADRWLVTNAYLVEQDGSNRVLVVHTDVTARRQASQALADSRREQEVVFEKASDGIVISDMATGRIVKANQQAADMFGYPLDELLERRISDLLPEDELRRDPIDLDTIRAGRRVMKERVGIRKDGRRIPIEINASLLEDGRLLGMVRDVASRKRRAAAVRRQAVRLGERVKEQRTLYAVSRVLQTVASLDAALTEVVSLLPAGWQHPQLAEARATLDGKEYTTPGFGPTTWCLTRPITVEGVQRGVVEVAYRERPPAGARGGRALRRGPSGAVEGAGGAAVPEGAAAPTGPAARGAEAFLVEEDALLEEVAARVGETVRRRQAEERLRRSEAYYRTLTEKAVDMVAIAGPDGVLRYLSPSFESVLGFTRAERLGRSVFELVHPTDEPRLREEFEAALRDPSYQPTVEFRIRSASGEWRLLESTGRNLLSDPAIEGVVIESRDVTARRAAEEQIRFQARLLDLVGQAVVATDADGCVTYWNRAAESVYGWTREESLGRDAADVLPMDLSHRGSRALAEAVARRERWSGEIVVKRRDGSPLPLLVADEPITGEDGAFAGYVAVASDISELKAAERAVRESEERLRSLAENASELTVVLDRDGRVTYSSPNRERVLGSPAESTLGRSFLELDPLHPDDMERAATLWAAVLETPDATLTDELRVRHADGSWRLLEVSARNLLDNPAVRGVVVNARDLTERAQLKQQLQQAQKMEAVGRLAGGVAHDFNNLLTGVKGYTQLALEALPPDHPVYGDLSEVERAAERAARLTQQLLAFSRRQVMQPRVMDPNTTIAELKGMLARLIGEDLQLVTELADDVGHVHVDPGQLEQVIVNLVVNARDAMPLGGRLAIRTRRATLDARALEGEDAELEPGEYVELSVSDTGAGMPPDVLERVFEPFFTTKQLGKGTGLGLSTVYGIVRQSGGVIRVESEPGDGTTFRVLFPLVSAPDRAEAPDGEPPAAEAARGGETVLLVEDDDAVRKLASRVLRARGYRVLTASNGAEGLQRFDAARSEGTAIDLILSDVVMPQLGGRQMVELMRKTDAALPVVFMSGYTDDVLLRHGVEGMGAEFLEKPFTPATLAARVRAALDERSERARSDGRSEASG